MDLKNILGYTATVVSTVTFLPQVIRTWSSKSTGDFSFTMILLAVFGGFLWLLYGIILKAYPIIIANVIVMSCFIIILSFKLKYK